MNYGRLIQFISVAFVFLGCEAKITDKAIEEEKRRIEGMSKEQGTSNLVLLKNSTVDDQKTCAANNLISLRLIVYRDNQLLCRDNSLVPDELRVGAVCESGAEIKKWRPEKLPPFVDCRQSTLCGIAPSAVQRETVDMNGGEVYRLDYAGLPWGCEARIESMLADKSSRKRLSVKVQTPACNFCEYTKKLTCGPCQKDDTPPKISIKIDNFSGDPSKCSIFEVKVDATEDTALHETPYSFDSGKNWQREPTKSFKGTKIELATGQIQVRDINNNIASNVELISSQSASCSCTTAWGESVKHGEKVKAFRQFSGTECRDLCVVENSGYIMRSCNNGILEGDEKYFLPRCVAASCVHCQTAFANGEIQNFVRNEKTQVFRAADPNCLSIQSTCTEKSNNVFEWSPALPQFYTSSCQKSCTYKGQTYPSGAKVNYYDHAGTACKPCDQMTATCMDGKWNQNIPAATYPTCNSSLTNLNLALVGGSTIINQTQSATIYEAKTTKGDLWSTTQDTKCGIAYQAVTASCANGSTKLTNAFKQMTYQDNFFYKTSLDALPKCRCIFNGTAYPDGQSLTVFKSDKVLCGQTIDSHKTTLNCDNGFWKQAGQVVTNISQIQTTYNRLTIPTEHCDCTRHFKVRPSSTFSAESYKGAPAGKGVPQTVFKLDNGTAKMTCEDGELKLFSNVGASLGLRTQAQQSSIPTSGVFFDYAFKESPSAQSCIFVDGSEVAVGGTRQVFKKSNGTCSEACGSPLNSLTLICELDPITKLPRMKPQDSANSGNNDNYNFPSNFSSYAFSKLSCSDPACGCTYKGKMVVDGVEQSTQVMRELNQTMNVFTVSTAPNGKSCADPSVKKTATCLMSSGSPRLIESSGSVLASDYWISCKDTASDLGVGGGRGGGIGNDEGDGFGFRKKGRGGGGGGGSGSEPNFVTWLPYTACKLPWGGHVGVGTYVPAFDVKEVTNGDVCSKHQKILLCANGRLTGSDRYRFPTCSEPERYSSCVIETVGGPTTLQHGDTLRLFKESSPSFGKICEEIMIRCENGVVQKKSSIDLNQYRHKMCVLPKR